MKSIKPGRGPSSMNFISSIISIAFGIFWTIMALNITSGRPLIGIFFPLFGILFVVKGIVNAVYNYKNATGKNRFSTFDITESKEESDPFDKLIKKEETKSQELPDEDNKNFCHYCGTQVQSDYNFCNKCGKKLH